MKVSLFILEMNCKKQALRKKNEMSCVLLVEKTAYFVIVNEYTGIIKEKIDYFNLGKFPEHKKVKNI